MRSAVRRPALTRLATTMLAAALALAGAVTAPAMAMAAEVTDGLVLQYDLNQSAGTTVTDASGNGNDGTVSGDATWSADGLQLGGTNGFVGVPDNIMSGLTEITVSVDVLIDPSQQTAYMIWAFGNTDASGVGNGYLMATGNSYRTSIGTGNWSTEQTVNSNAPLQRGVWKSLAYTLDASGTAIQYLDGVEVGRKTDVTVEPGDIGAGVTTANYLGRSVYTADRYLKGTVKNFRVYNRALTAAEATEISISPSIRVAADKAALTLGDTSAVTTNLTLPTAGSAYGTTISWESSDPAVVSPAGVVTRPNVDRTVTLTATLSAGAGAGAVTDTKAFQVTVLAALAPEVRANAAADALSVPNIDDVRGHLTLPVTGIDTATVSWATSAPDTISDTGLVNRPAHGSPAASVTLTASVTVAGATVTRDFTATVPALPELQPFTGYAFTYFTGDTLSGEKIYLARSNGNNALSWTETNNGRPILTSTLGTKGLRDPYVLRSPEGDKFYLIATDLSIGSGTSWGDAQTNGSKYLEVWESYDLVNWSEQRHVKVAPDNAGDAWAPEAFFSAEENAYVVYWASNVTRDGSTYHRMFTATTRDFYTFSEPQIWQDPGSSVIDSTVLKDGDTYYRFTKDEGRATGCSDILQEKSTDLLAVDDIEDPAYDPANRSWQQVASCIGRTAGTSAVEGPTAFKANEGDTSGYDYYLFVDEYGGRGYIPLGSNDPDTAGWAVATGYDLPTRPRHGTVVPVTQAELDALSAPLPAPDPLPADDDGLILDYPMTQTSGTTVADASGNDNTGTVTGGATWTGTSLSLGGTNGYVKLPDNAMAGLDAITVSADVYINAAQATPYFIWGMGNTDASGAGDGYLFATGNAYRTAITSGNWAGEQNVTSGSNLARGVWATLTYTLTPDGVAAEYLNGAQVGQNTAVTVKPGQIGGGYTTANYIGKSVYNADRYLSGQVKNFKLYNRALSPGEVAGLAGGTGIVGSDSDDLKAPAIVTDASNLVVLPVKPGTDLTAFDPELIIADGSIISETGPQDYSAPRTVTVIGSSGTRTWTVEAHVMNSPLIATFADPNIVKFGDTYYMYGTTDGFTGWSGTTFTVWSSTNLVDWESHDTILDLADVSWSNVNAWAPTITEKDGTYYFYFCAGGNIGVATADSPLGPFVDKGTPLIARADYNNAQQIDPAAFTDDDGKSYLYWGNGTAYVAPLNADMTSIDVAQRTTIGGLTNFREGLFMNKRNGTYYLTYSIDDTGSANYRVGYATATSPTGPFTYQGEILNKRPELGILATGHSSILQVPGTDDWYIAYHRFEMPGGNGYNRETTIDRLYFNADGTIKPVVPTLESIQALDTTAPATTATLDPVDPSGEDGWWTGPVTVTLAATDSGGVGVASTSYAIGDGAWTAYTAPVTVEAQGVSTISFRSTDRVGNVEAVGTIDVKLDTQVPEVAANVDGDDPVTLSIIASDATSGVGSVEFRIGSGAWAPYTEELTIARTSAAQTVQFRAFDVGGNESVTRAVTIAAKQVDPVASQTLLSVSPASIPFGAKATATVKVTAGGASVGTGLVSVYADGELIAAGVLRNGVATIPVGGLAVGSHRLTASFAGNATVAPSETASSKPLTVVKATSTVTLKTSSAVQIYGTTKPVTLTATVALNSKQVPAGKVRFRDGSTVIGTVAVVSGRASIRLSRTATVGRHSLTAEFLPASPQTTVGARSAATKVTVLRAASTTQLKADRSIQRKGKTVLLTAKVALETKQQATGSVRFLLDGKVVRTVAVSGGVAKYTLPGTTKVGRHTIKAQFVPKSSATVIGSTSGTVTIRITS